MLFAALPTRSCRNWQSCISAFWRDINRHVICWWRAALQYHR